MYIFGNTCRFSCQFCLSCTLCICTISCKF